MRRLAVCCAILAGFAPPVLADVVWHGDFETGNIKQYTGTEMVSPDRLAIVEDPVREGRYALRAVVKQGDDPINASGNRNELFHETFEREGSEYYYRWSTLFPAGFPSVKTWQLFVQWHHTGCCGSPPVEFYVYGEELRLRVGGANGVQVWSTPLVRGVWQDFVFHARWSADPAIGFVELFHNRELAVPKRHMANLYAGTRNYLKIGLYRNESVVPDGVVFHDAMIQATTLEDVLRAPKPSDLPAPIASPRSDPPLAQPTGPQVSAVAGCATGGVWLFGPPAVYALLALLARRRASSSTVR